MRGGRADARRLWLAGLGAGLVCMGIALSWPQQGPELDCPSASIVRDADGVARCTEELAEPGAPLKAGQAFTLGRKLNLNEADAEALQLLPGVGAGLARALVEGRQRVGRFESWDQVDAVPGIGPAKLETLKAHSEIR